jgi:hypothetical protein
MLDAGFSFGIGGVVAISEYSSHKLLPLSPRAPHSGALSMFYTALLYTSRCTVGVVGKFMCKYESLCVFPRFFR